MFTIYINCGIPSKEQREIIDHPKILIYPYKYLKKIRTIKSQTLNILIAETVYIITLNIYQLKI